MTAAVVALLAFLSGAGTAAVWGWLDEHHQVLVEGAGVVDMDGNRAEVDLLTDGLTPEQIEDVAAGQADEAAHPGAGVKTRFRAPSVNLDVPLRSLRVVGGVITPPGFTSAYTVSNLGVQLPAASQGTVYVAMHSMRGRGVAPGDYLFDTVTGASKLNVGDTLTVGEVTYVVDETLAVSKAALPDEHWLWAPEPGRLVVITCLQVRAATPSVDNFVVVAHLAE